MKSVAGVYLDIEESDYTFQTNGMLFYFSSLFYLKKFKESVKNIKEENLKLENKYKCKIDATYFLLLILYNKIEKRGFKVVINGKIFKELPTFIIR